MKHADSKMFEEHFDSDACANILVVKTSFGSVVINFTLDNDYLNPCVTDHIENHYHTVFEFQYILSGTGVFIADNKEYRINSNTYCVIGPNVYHELKSEAQDPIIKFCFYAECKMTSEKQNLFLKEEGNDIIDTLCNIRFFYHQCSNNLLFMVLSEIYKEIQNRQVGYYSRLQSLFKLLLIHIVREINSGKKADYEIPLGSLEDKNTLVIDRFFDTNYHKKVTAGQLAKLLHVSISQLNRIMKEKYNMTFMQKLIETRMDSAKSLLRNTSIPIKEISEQVGYHSECNFHYMFKLKYNCTPGEYRRQNGNTELHK